MRWERFCQLYAGACFGNASKAYIDAGYRPKGDDSARKEGSRLLTNVDIEKRIAHLRRLRMKELAIDQTRIMEMRLKIIYNADSGDGDKLRALDSIEKALGLNQPEKVEHSMAEGAVIRFINNSEEKNES
jgi:phage terminase small subunit